MLRKITCIDCPQGCQLEVEIENNYVVKVTGNKCEKGVPYAKQEIENPMRVVTTTVLTKGLGLKMVPVRTIRPIPKTNIMAALEEIKKTRLDRPAKAGDMIADNWVVTREVN